MSKYKQSAWLITWEWCGDHAAVEDRVVAILRPKLSCRVVAEIVEAMYAVHALYPDEMALWARRRSEYPYKAQWYNDHCFCGDNPSLNANKVSKLSIEADPETGLETISWLLPPLWRINSATGRPEQQRGPLPQSTTRTITGPFSSRETGRYDPNA